MSLSLKIENVWKSYNREPVLKGCTYSFDKGGIYALMGQNGSGKSTLLRICSMIEKPDKGIVSYISAGNVLEQDISLKRKITLVLPTVGVFNDSVYRNVAYGLKIRGIPYKEIRERVCNILELVKLTHKKDQHALTLSSGETQRVGIARALIIKPEMLFLDEPTASVDTANTKIIEDVIPEMKSRGITIILTTHDQLQAKRLADQLLIVKDGKLING
ncbi:MAG: ATP-binding cassette domain-containing protein [Nitrospirae bacterium]|nr:ATP-binding cassette domain-containing protein [Nitrospirota bacterium]